MWIRTLVVTLLGITLSVHSVPAKDLTDKARGEAENQLSVLFELDFLSMFSQAYYTSIYWFLAAYRGKTLESLSWDVSFDSKGFTDTLIINESEMGIFRAVMDDTYNKYVVSVKPIVTNDYFGCSIYYGIQLFPNKKPVFMKECNVLDSRDPRQRYETYEDSIAKQLFTNPSSLEYYRQQKASEFLLDFTVNFYYNVNRMKENESYIGSRKLSDIMYENGPKYIKFYRIFYNAVLRKGGKNRRESFMNLEVPLEALDPSIYGVNGIYRSAIDYLKKKKLEELAHEGYDVSSLTDRSFALRKDKELIITDYALVHQEYKVFVENLDENPVRLAGTKIKVKPVCTYAKRVGEPTSKNDRIFTVAAEIQRSLTQCEKKAKENYERIVIAPAKKQEVSGKKSKIGNISGFHTLTSIKEFLAKFSSSHSKNGSKSSNPAQATNDEDDDDEWEDEDENSEFDVGAFVNDQSFYVNFQKDKFYKIKRKKDNKTLLHILM